MFIIDEPWMTDREIAFIVGFLNNRDTMLEWGSGGSTVYFSRIVHKYYSIEHDPAWYNAVKHELTEKNITNVSLFLSTRTRGNTPAEIYGDYIATAGKMKINPSKVLIDGRCRRRCAIAALDFIGNDTVVFIHDFKREYYHSVLDYYYIVDIYDKDQQVVALKRIINTTS